MNLTQYGSLSTVKTLRFRDEPLFIDMLVLTPRPMARSLMSLDNQ